MNEIFRSADGTQSKQSFFPTQPPSTSKIFGASQKIWDSESCCAKRLRRGLTAAPAVPEGLRLGLGWPKDLDFRAYLILNLLPSTKAKRLGAPEMQSATNQRSVLYGYCKIKVVVLTILLNVHISLDRRLKTILDRKLSKFFFLTSIAFALNSCLYAVVVVPISYQVSQQLADGPYFYPDNGVRLTDGIEGLPLDAVEPADRGWDGWWNPSPTTEFIAPTINFDFGSFTSVTGVSINVLRWDEAAVYLPKQVKIQNQLFSVDSEALLNQSAGWLSFNGSWDTATLNVSIEDFWKRGFNPGNPPPTGGWSFIGEVAINGVPEPSALSLLAVGLGVVLRQRRRTV